MSLEMMEEEFDPFFYENKALMDADVDPDTVQATPVPFGWFSQVESAV